MRAAAYFGLASIVMLAATPASADLRAAEGVYEEAHRIDVTLHPGLAVVETHLSFRSINDAVSELTYDVRDAGALASMQVCIGSRCRDAIPDRSGDHLNPYYLDLVAPRGSAGPLTPVALIGCRRSGYPYRRRCLLRAAPVSSSHPLDVTLRFVVATELHGGHVWLRLPVTGTNTETEVTLSAPGHEDPRIDGHEGLARLAPGHVALITARMSAAPGPTAVAWRVGCGTSVCTRSWVGAPYRGTPRDVVLVIDASASMQDVPAGRLQRTVQGILDAMPTSTFRVVAFGRDTEVRLGEASPPDRVDAAAVTRGWLGNLSRSAPVWPLISDWVRSASSPLVIFVSDGRLSVPAPPFPTEMSFVNVSEQRNDSLGDVFRRTGGIAIELGEELARDVQGPIAHHLMQLGAEVALTGVTVPGSDAVPLRAGEAAEHEGVGLRDVRGPGLHLHPHGAPAEIDEGLASWLGRRLGQSAERELIAVDRRDFSSARAWGVGGRRRYPRVHGAVEVSHRVSEFSLAGPCDPTTVRGALPMCGARVARYPRIIACGGGLIRGSVSREALGLMMRGARPGVRGCFAAARRGRRDWEVSFMYRILLGYREVVRATIVNASPTVDEELRRCLLDRPIRSLVIPRSDGYIEMNYPFSTRRHTEEASVALHDEVGSLLDAIGADESEPEPTSTPPSSSAPTTAPEEEREQEPEP